MLISNNQDPYERSVLLVKPVVIKEGIGSEQRPLSYLVSLLENIL